MQLRFLLKIVELSHLPSNPDAQLELGAGAGNGGDPGVGIAPVPLHGQDGEVRP
jgi:hypothetical protein